jgi:SpoVK/Ycf46/Vps4 family AAA+-type ATPase
MAPCVCFLDEVEKAFSGVGNSGQTDSGVSARLFGTFLSWLNDHESDVFVVATANDITKLPPELSRAERFDGVFFLDLPSAEQRQAIWKIYIERYQLDASQKLPADDDWSGAEIKACCRLAALLDLPLIAAAQNIVPVARTSARIGRQAAAMGGRALLVSRSAGHLSARKFWPGLTPASEPLGRLESQLTARLFITRAPPQVAARIP